MNYWVFDGEDIVGPLAPQELAARADFSVDTLICAENESENQDAWRPAGTFEELKFGEDGRLLQAIAPAPKENTFRAPITASVTQTVSVPQQPEKPVVIRLSKEETEPEEAEAQTVRLVQGDDIVLPLKEKTEDASAAEKPQQETALADKPLQQPTPPAAPVKNTAAPEQKEEPAKQKTAEEKSSLVEAEMITSTALPTAIPALPDEMANTVTIPVLGEPLPEEALEEVLTEPDFDVTPPVKVEVEAAAPAEKTAETITTPQEPEEKPTEQSVAKELPAESAPAVKETTPVTEEKSTVETGTSAKEETISAPEEPAPESPENAIKSEPVAHDPKEDTVKNIFSGSVAVEETKEVKEPFAAMGPQQMSLVKPKLDSTPAIEKILNKQRELLKPSRTKAKGMLWVLLLLILPGIVWMAVLVGGNKKAPATPTAPAQPPVFVEEKQPPQPTVTPSLAPQKVEVPPAPVTAGDQAMAIVQNYGLSGNKGTIAAYFDRIYQKQLREGYEASWSAEPLHKNTYIVKYRLTKPRMEPVVYVFQVDVSRKRLTGALNNITLDLVGKIQ